MRKGFLATLFAAAVSFAGTTVAFAAAPVISPISDLQIGDLEDNIGTDNNYFVFTNAFQFSPKVADADTTDGALLWSFAEKDYTGANPAGSNTTQEFQINGKNPIAVGDTAIAAEAGGGYLNAKAPGANRLNASSDYASFRDIVFSPLAGSPPFATGIGLLTANQVTQAGNLGKAVVFYCADPEGNLAQDIVQVKTKDQDFDKVSTSWTPITDEPAFTGWIESGLNSDTPLAQGGTDDVDRTDNTAAAYETGQGSPSAGATEIGTIVRASSGRYRILGWTNPTGIPYQGAANYVRGKFYIYTNNGAADATNKYPNFRARIQHGGAYVGVTNFQFAATGNTGGAGGNFPYNLTDNATIETASGQYFKPSRTPAKPSLYRVDFDPVDVPAAAATPIVPTFESFAFNDPAAANILLTQVTLGTFPALTDGAGTQVMSYTRATTAASQGISATFGGFNAENNFTSGYKQNLFIGATANFATGSEQGTVNTTGLTVDTGATNTDYTTRFVVGIVDVQPTANASRPRIAAGKYYRGRFYATSDVPTTAAATGTMRQGNLRFRLQTAFAVVNCYQEFVGAISTAANTAPHPAYKDGVVGGQAMPGINSQNPDVDPSLVPAGQDGGWYTVLMPSPLDGDIRRDVNPAGVVDASTFGTLFGEPGFGSSSASNKDIKTGMDIYTNPRDLVVGASTFPAIYDANRAKVSLTAVKLFEYDAALVTDDGGYAY